MGPVTTRIVLFVASLALLAPGIGHADTTWYHPGDYALGPQGGDDNNTFMVDESTGEVFVLRHQLAGITGGLGCGGSGGFAFLQVKHKANTPVKFVTVTYDEATVDPYTFVKASVRKGGSYLATTNVRGPVLGTGTFRVTLRKPATGTLTVWFGIEVTSACPNVDGGRAIFTGVGVTSV